MVGRSVRRQALDLNFARHLVQDAAGSLDTQRNADQLDAHFDPDRLVQLAMRFRSMWISRSGIGSRCKSTIMALAEGKPENLHIEDGVVAGFGEKNPGNLLRIHFNGRRVVPGAIKYGGNLDRNAHAARGILVELALAGLGYDYFRHSVSRFSFRARAIGVRSLC